MSVLSVIRPHYEYHGSSPLILSWKECGDRYPKPTINTGRVWYNSTPMLTDSLPLDSVVTFASRKHWSSLKSSNYFLESYKVTLFSIKQSNLIPYDPCHSLTPCYPWSVWMWHSLLSGSSLVRPSYFTIRPRTTGYFPPELMSTPLLDGSLKKENSKLVETVSE